MKATLRIGTVAGVSVGLHWSVLGVVALLVIIVSTGMASAYPGHSPVAYGAAGLLAAVLFGLSLLAHEVAHAVVATRNGIEVEDITLWLLGGVARLKGDAATPGADFRIAAVGPLVSLLAAVAFAVLTWLASAIGIGAPWTPVLGYLAAVNVLLAIFNLVPAAPLDGGRVLRSILWAWRGDRAAAAVWSARAGRAFGLFLLLVGVFGFLFGFTGGFWWVLVGLFILVIAGAEERQAELGSALAGLRVRDVMTQDPDTAPGDVDIERFLHQTALVRRHSAFPLLDETGRLEGLITLNRMKTVPPEERASTSLRRAACPPEEIPLAAPDEPLDELLPRLSGCTDGRALVFDGDRLAGIVSPSDISRAVALRGLGVEFAPGAGSDTERGTVV